MGRLEIYTSKKKSILLLVAAILFIAAGIWFVLSAEEIATSNAGWRLAHSPILVRLLGVASVLLGGFGAYVTVKRIIKTEIAIVVDETGVTINAITKSEFIKWEDIAGFNEIKIYRNRMIMIEVKNPERWIEKETSAIKRKLMQLNLSGYGSPFSVAASGLDISDDDLIERLMSYFEKYGNK